MITTTIGSSYASIDAQLHMNNNCWNIGFLLPAWVKQLREQTLRLWSLNRYASIDNRANWYRSHSGGPSIAWLRDSLAGSPPACSIRDARFAPLAT